MFLQQIPFKHKTTWTGTPALLLGTLAQLVSPWYFGMITAFIPK